MVRPAVFSSKKIQLCSKTCQNNPSRIWLFLLRLYKNIFSYVYLYMTNHPGLELKKLLDSHFHGSVVALFKQKLWPEDWLDQKIQQTIVAFIALFAIISKTSFIGYYIKSDLWLFNGGHIAEGEILWETVVREIGRRILDRRVDEFSRSPRESH